MKPVKTLIVPQRLIDKGMNSQTFLADEGIEIFSFRELRDYVSELSCLYPDSILYFRGQHTDHKRKSKKFGEASTFLPSLYRGNPGKVELNRRWGNLEAARQILTQKLEEYPGGKNKEFDFLKAKRLAQWSVIQHYEIAFTPLLDVTQSLRVACSFALDGLSVSQEYAYVYVFALPYPTGRITVNSEHYLTLIRLFKRISFGNKETP